MFPTSFYNVQLHQWRERHIETPKGRCPYCQQELPDDFEEQIAACFDKQYQEDNEALRQFQEAYASDMQGFLDTLNSNLQNIFPKLDLTVYKSNWLLLKPFGKSNTNKMMMGENDTK